MVNSEKNDARPMDSAHDGATVGGGGGGTGQEPQNSTDLSVSVTWAYESVPLNIVPSACRRIRVVPLVWSGLTKKPSKMEISNLDHNLIVAAEYSGSIPSLEGSVLRCPYLFWGFHFHWGTTDDNGSEHRISGKKFPMEVHLLFYNSDYANTTEALNAIDGILILVYLCNLRSDKTPTLERLTSNLEKIKTHGKSTKIKPFPLSSFVDGDLKNHLVYWSTKGNDETKLITWIISSKPVFISNVVLSRIRTLQAASGNCTISSRPPSKTTDFNNVFRIARSPLTADSLWQDVNDNDEHLGPDRSDKPPSVMAETATPTIDGFSVTIANSTTYGRDAKTNLSSKRFDLEGSPEPEVTTNVWNLLTRDENPNNQSREKAFDDLKPTKDTVMRSIDSLLSELSIVQEEYPSEKLKEPEEQTHREGVRMNTTALRRELHIKQKILQAQNKNINNSNFN